MAELTAPTQEPTRCGLVATVLLPEPDKYDRAEAYLREHPEEIGRAWTNGLLLGRHSAGVLFGGVTGECRVCLTMVRAGVGASDQALVPVFEAIAADKRIPIAGSAITVDHLPVFAEWQRRLDKELKRV